jgi:DNA-binding NtrC family response regulator
VSESGPAPLPTPATVLVVDDEKNIRRTLRMVLEGEGYTVSEAGSAPEARSALADAEPDVIFMDVKLGDDSGVELLEELMSRDHVTPVIMISGHASIEDAVRATRLGAYDFLEKPLERNRVLVTARNAYDHRRMQLRVYKLREAVEARFELLGSSNVMSDLKRQIARVAPTKSRVLITGESGTGKELIARAIHRNSAFADEAFVKVNCAAIPPELIESELFGHERGAFTGAVARKRGLFEVADGGTIFLDEIGDMSLSAQAKVLRVLQTGEFSRVGGEQTLKTDCRVVAATNKDLEKAVEDHEFREDLYFRLNVVPINSAPLRERREDIPTLVEAFTAECCDENGFSHKLVAPEVMEKLQQYEWPGNVRELRNVVERLVIMSDEIISESDLPPYLGGARPEVVETEGSPLELEAFLGHSLREFREELETRFILYRLDEHGWNISRTAVALGIERTNLHKKMRSLGIKRRNK